MASTASLVSPGTIGNDVDEDRNHARDVGRGLLERHAVLESRDAARADRRDERERRAIGWSGVKMSAGCCEEAERRRQHADDLVRRAIDDERLSEHVFGAAEAPLPIAVRKNDGRRAARLVVGLRRTCGRATAARGASAETRACSRAVCTSSGSPAPVMVAVFPEQSATDSNVWLCSR